LSEILARGVRFNLLRELWDGAGTRNSVNAPVVLTFDDGLASHYEVAYPLLSRIGAKAEFFVNTATIGHPGYLTWPHIMEMHRAGMSFQSHGHDHVDLSRLSLRSLERRVVDSKHLIEDRLGCAVDFLAIPYGLVNNRVMEAALEAGYRAVCDSGGWPARPGGRRICRVPIYGHTTLREFRRLLSGNALTYAARQARALFVALPKRLLLHLAPARLGVRVLEEQN